MVNKIASQLYRRINMNILILNGSPRKNGNTKFMIDAFIEGAKKSNDITGISCILS